MNESVMLVRASLLSILLFTIHVADDMVRGFEPGTAVNLPTLPILFVWLYAALMLVERRVGQIILLLGGLLSTVVPILHLSLGGVGGKFAKTDGALLFIVTILALGAIGPFSTVLAARAMWRKKV